MSSIRVTRTTVHASRHPRTAAGRVRRYAEARAAATRSRRELASVLAGEHGETMRKEIKAALRG